MRENGRSALRTALMHIGKMCARQLGWRQLLPQHRVRQRAPVGEGLIRRRSQRLVD